MFRHRNKKKTKVLISNLESNQPTSFVESEIKESQTINSKIKYPQKQHQQNNSSK